MVPTRCRTLGVKAHRPVVGTWDGKDLLYVFASVNVATSARHTSTVGSRTGLLRRTGECKPRRLQRAFAAHLRQIAARDPAGRHARVALIIDHAPWHPGDAVRAALAGHPHLERKRRPGDSPQRNVIERLWTLLRRRAPHNRLFDALADLKRSIRNSLCYFQTVKDRVRTLIADCYPRPTNRTALTGP